MLGPTIIGLLAFSLCTYGKSTTLTTLPTVDLGYQIHQASSFNESGSYYNFSNVRFGQPTAGSNRWRPPLPPQTNRSVVQTGSVGRICPQAFPVWYEAMLASFGGQTAAEQAANLENTDPMKLLPPADPRENEDCLFLDVLVPENVFAQRNSKDFQGAPVMVWVYGGGFTFTDSGGNPAGLIRASQNREGYNDGIIYVRINYRGGAFGFLSGTELQANGQSNVGLLDQRLALDWVKSNIHLFGGNSGQVTVFGQSAGAGSILHQITAYGGRNGPLPFRRAIMQSPGFHHIPAATRRIRYYNSILDYLTSVAEARRLPFSILQQANINIVAKSPHGRFTFAPVVDGNFVPALPSELLVTGSFDQSLQVLTAHNKNETIYFVDQNATSDADFRSNLVSAFPTIQQPIVDYIAEDLYPLAATEIKTAESKKSPPLYYTNYGRDILSSMESSFTCNVFDVNQAFSRLHPNNTFSYRFALDPGFHGQDVYYTYFNGDPISAIGPLNETIAEWMQTYITEFAISENGANPNRKGAKGLPFFQAYGVDGDVLELTNTTGATLVPDPNANERCLWWQRDLFY